MTSGFPVPQDSVEAGLLNSVNGNMLCWLEVSKFEADDFISHKDIFRFFGEYLTNYASLPTNTTISTRFQWQPPIGEFQYWLTEMKRYSLARKVMDAMLEAHAHMSEPRQSIDILLDKLGKIRSEENHHIGATDAGGTQRLEKFDVRTQYIFNSNSLVGLPTGIKLLDDTHIGWIPGSMVGIYARPGVGKTWWLIEQGALTYMTGRRVLAITPEMPKPMLDLRIDVVLAQHMGLPIDYARLIVGDPSIRLHYEQVTEEMAKADRWWTYDSIDEHAISPADIAALVRQHEPDILLVDNISLLKAGRGQVWEQMKELSYDLKNIGTIHDLPIIVTHQAVNSNRGRRTEIAQTGRGDDFVMPSLNDAAYGDSFVGACSDVITLVGDANVDYLRWYSIRKHRERAFATALPGRIGMAVNYGLGLMIDLSPMGHEPERVGAEARRLLGVR